MSDTDARTLLPSNASPQERAVEQATSRSDTLPVTLDTLWSPGAAPTDVLPFLAWALSVDEWDAQWSDEAKRDTLRQVVAVHRLKGTLGAVRRVLAALGTDVDVTEWWQKSPQGQPHTFDLLALANRNINPDGEAILTDRLYGALQRAIDATKPVRSHYTFRVGAGFDQTLGLAGPLTSFQGVRETMEPPPMNVVIDGGRLSTTAGAANLTLARFYMDAGAPAVRLGAATLRARAGGLGVTLLRAGMEANA